MYIVCEYVVCMKVNEKENMSSSVIHTHNVLTHNVHVQTMYFYMTLYMTLYSVLFVFVYLYLLTTTPPTRKPNKEGFEFKISKYLHVQVHVHGLRGQNIKIRTCTCTGTSCLKHVHVVDTRNGL